MKDFYLGTILAQPVYIRIHRRQIPAVTILLYDLEGLFYNDYIIVEVTKGIYGLPQAEILAQERLIAKLGQHGYRQVPNTPCLFKHDTRSIMFVLVVDDFGVKYKAS